MPNGVPFSQMTTQYTRQLFEGDSSDDESMTPDEFFDELDEIFGSNDGYMYHLERIKDLKEQKELNMFHLKEFVKKVEKLEAENEKLKEELDEKYSFSYFKQVKELTAENEKLKAENEKLKLMDPKLMEMAQTFDKIIQNQSKTSS